ncbi:hypothetical protein ZIOFF_006422 [Zingiber officinale]|uniref:Aminotransferase-like plant mobile domain-containing protein n=1 Tax=Zingiber officinale TaxID=94328 RepID=A0A8J5M532_ZINOF|nr:hypothetical protein ZIOFF_006422 [Zingiber officinale]
MSVAGFLGVFQFGYRRIDGALITALLERWRPETHSFHMPEGEMTVTLQDVAVLLGLPIHGSAISGRANVDIYDYCLSQILGPLLLLQLWAWERFTQCRPIIRGGIEHTPMLPLGTRWAGKKEARQSPRFTLQGWRYEFDVQTHHQISWEPYAQFIHQLDPICLSGQDIWTARVPLICFNVVEWYYPDRVRRQFGWLQFIPVPPFRHCGYHSTSQKEKYEVDWRVEWAKEINIWNNRQQFAVHSRGPRTRQPRQRYVDPPRMSCDSIYEPPVWRDLSMQAGSSSFTQARTSFGGYPTSGGFGHYSNPQSSSEPFPDISSMRSHLSEANDDDPQEGNHGDDEEAGNDAHNDAIVQQSHEQNMGGRIPFLRRFLPH